MRSPPRLAYPTLRLDETDGPEISSHALVGRDRKALGKELGKARAMTKILATQSAETRARGESLIRQADKLMCESWNERMWSDAPIVRAGADGRELTTARWGIPSSSKG